MAKKTEDLETDTVIAAKVIELKKELQRVLKSILEEGEYGIESIVEAMKILGSLTEMIFKEKSEASFDVDGNIVVPEEFRCPISKEIMSDPVILATGQTYDRPCIERWLSEGKKTCPQSQEVLTHTDLTPNHLVQDMISHWCKEHGIKLPKPAYHIGEEVITGAAKGYLNLLLEKLSSFSISEQNEAAKELRQLTKRMPYFRALFGESNNVITLSDESNDVITRLLTPNTVIRAASEPDFQEDLITTVLNILIHDNNKKLVVEHPFIIHVLLDPLGSGQPEESGEFWEPSTIEARRNAATALFILSTLDSNRLIIGEYGALSTLIHHLGEGDALTMKDATTAIFNLCIASENKERAVREGAVRVIVKMIKARKFVDELLTVLAILSGHKKAVDEMVELDAVPCLLRIITESNCERSKEKCVAILYNICYDDMSKLMEIRQEENANGTFSKLIQSGTSKAKRNAFKILDKLNRAASSSNTA